MREANSSNWRRWFRRLFANSHEINIAARMSDARGIPKLPLALLAYLLAYVCLYAKAMALFGDPDVTWHIATGDLIRSIGTLPATDRWSFTANGQPWYIISWLWDVLISLICQAVGTSGLFIFSMALSALSIGFLAWNIVERKDAGIDATILILLLATLSLVGFTAARPQLAGYLFILLYHRLLHRSRTPVSMRALYWLPPVMALWVNLHASFLVGFSLIGAYGLEALMLKRWAWFKQLVRIGALCALAALCNPYGIDAYVAVSRTLGSAVTAYILEWQPFIFNKDTGATSWFVMFLLASGMRDRSVPPADRIISLFWWLAMLVSMRNISVFILVSAPYMAISVQRWLETLDSIRTRRDDIGDALAKAGATRKMVLVIVLVMAASIAMLPVLRGESYLVEPEKDARPAIAYILAHYPSKRFLTDYSLGGSIIYYARGKVPVFVDGRAGTAYSEEVLIDYIDFVKLQADWRKLVGKYRLEGMLIGNDQHFAIAYAAGQYHAEWRRVYQDAVASIFVRK